MPRNALVKNTPFVLPLFNAFCFKIAQDVIKTNLCVKDLSTLPFINKTTHSGCIKSSTKCFVRKWVHGTRGCGKTRE